MCEIGTGGVSGAYNILDDHNRLIVGRERKTLPRGPECPGNRRLQVADEGDPGYCVGGFAPATSH